MKKFFAVFIWLFGTIALLTSCSSNKAPSCELTLTSTGTSVSYSLSFADLSKKQTSYKIEILKGETSVKEEVSSTDITAGQFSNLDLNTNYKVNVYVTNKTEWDVSLASKEIQTKKGTITGVTFNSQSFVYDGNPKSIEVSDIPDVAGNYTVVYSGNGVTEVGDYTVTATVKKENYEDLVLTAKITITPASSDFVIADKTVTYTGEAQTIKAVTDLEVTYEYYLGETKLESAPVNAGTYTVKAIYAGDKNHAKVEKTATLKIEKAASTITAEDITIKFGEEYDVAATCSAANASLTLEYYQGETKLDEKPTAIGSYTVKVIFDGNDNYKASSKTIALIITNPDNADVTITLDNISTVYGQTYLVAPTADHGVVLEDLVIKYYQLDGTEIEKPVNAGSYEIKITYAGNEEKFLNPASKTVTLTIAKADYDLSGFTFADVTYTYDGTEHSLKIVGTLPAGVNVSYTNNTLTEIGEIEVTATFTGDENNYNLIAPKTAVLKIVKQTITFTQSVQLTYGDTVDSNNLLSYMTYSGVTEQVFDQIKNDIVATLPDGVTGITNAGTYAIHITFAGTDYINALDIDVTLVVDKATHTIEVVGLENNTITRVAGSLFNYTANAQTDAQYTYSQDLRYASAGTYTDLVIAFEENENYLSTSKTINVVLTAPTAATDLFISEYYEGASNNKFIIIYNGTGAEVDLSEYSITLAVNGAIYD
ncbi:MAG: MBG domain-containing protein, partial [Anaeroplasmataceae bacterium]|nr:MBG domain-containing protein [Anaeroplasmataceae bacterium]